MIKWMVFSTGAVLKVRGTVDPSKRVFNIVVQKRPDGTYGIRRSGDYEHYQGFYPTLEAAQLAAEMIYG